MLSNLYRLWHISSVVYKEVAFQSIFALHLGALYPQRSESSIRKLVSSVKLNTWLGKILTSIFIAGFAIATVFLLSKQVNISNIELTVVSIISVYLAVILFFIVFMGLQMTTSFISTKTIEILKSFPLDRKDISLIMFFTFIKIFDVPLITALLVFPLVYIYTTCSVIGSLASLFSIIVTEVFALALVMALARFFYMKIAVGSRSIWRNILRVIYMLIWILPTLGIYILMNFASDIIKMVLASMEIPLPLIFILAVTYPFAFGFLIFYATFTQIGNPLILALSLTSIIGYCVLIVYAISWMKIMIVNISFSQYLHHVNNVGDLSINVSSPWLGLVKKDLRVASRSPAYTSVFMLPSVQMVIIVLTMSRGEIIGLLYILGVVVTASLLTVLIPPMLFSVEVVASAYTRSLPIRKRTLIGSKTILTIFIYMISLLVLLAMTLILGITNPLLLILGVMQIPAVSAASIIELLILARKPLGQAIVAVNLYTRISNLILVIIPGIILVILPIIVIAMVFIITQQLILSVLLLTTLLEFILALRCLFSIKN
ncbi:MAG: hypothetical protein QXP91_09075 [Candidatus Methanomethylicia archaeon]